MESNSGAMESNPGAMKSNPGAIKKQSKRKKSNTRRCGSVVEQLIRNQQAEGPIPSTGSNITVPVFNGYGDILFEGEGIGGERQ